MQDQTVPYSYWQACEKYLFTHKSFHLQGIHNDINEQDTFIFDCKHKLMMKSGAPPDNVGDLHLLLPIEFHGFTSRVITLWFLVLSQFFRDGMGPFKLELSSKTRYQRCNYLFILLYYIVCFIMICLMCKIFHLELKYNKFYSILFYSILFYSILFYSILFYSILFYSRTMAESTIFRLDF